MNIIESHINFWKPPSLPLKKKALLIGIQGLINQDNVERTAEEDMNAVPKRKGRKDREAPNLKGPHRDVMQVKQLLIGVLYH
jgi:hypothetical protein